MSTLDQLDLAQPVAPRAAPNFVVEPDWKRYRAWAPAKRAFDVGAALAGIVVSAPLLVIVALAVGVTSRGPILFGQRRVGRDGGVFRCWKFRTMYSDSEERLSADPALYERYVDNDFKLVVGEDPRVTPLGRFLRRTSLDELPQLFNVLTGTMSLVGPRPVVVDELEMYGPWKDAYLAAKPGITGPWQCSGRNEIRYPERAMLDAEYISSWRPTRDVKILLRTVPAVLKRNGVS